jgi:hypothetical protein
MPRQLSHCRIVPGYNSYFLFLVSLDSDGYERENKEGFQIVMFRSIRLDHTNCLQVDIKTHSFRYSLLWVHSYRSLLIPDQAPWSTPLPGWQRICLRTTCTTELCPFYIVVTTHPIGGGGSFFSRSRSITYSEAFSKHVHDMQCSTRTVSSEGGPGTCLT